MPRRVPVAFVAALATAPLGCTDDLAGPASPQAPAIMGATVAANPHHVLSAVVTLHVERADSAVVRFHPEGASAEEITPAVVPADDAAVIPVLGLLPETRYQMWAVAFGPGGSSVGGSLAFETGALPADLPHYHAAGVDPSPGYVVFAAGRYGLVIDNSGRVVWYREFPNGPGLNFTAQPNGRYAARPTTPDPGDLDLWVELDHLGELTRTFGCARGLQARFHDLIAEPDGGYWLLCDETRTMNLSYVGGAADARVTATNVQHIGPDGALMFEWSPFSHFDPAQADPAELARPNVNWTHGNSLDVDPDGYLLVSFRNLGEVTKIDPRTGEVVWRMGGRANQFGFVGAATPAFAGQHSVRAVAADTVLLLDNAGQPGDTRAERYVIAKASDSARLVRSYGSVPPVTTLIGGSVQHLPGGRTLVAYGTAGRVEEYDAEGRVVWSITGHAGYVFRAQRIRSLYRPGVGDSR
jgi:hypothetical protein